MVMDEIDTCITRDTFDNKKWSHDALPAEMAKSTF